jgi:hypothetical protein
MTFTEYRNSIERRQQELEERRMHNFRHVLVDVRAKQRRLERLTYIVAVVVGLAGAVVVGAALSGCGGSVLDQGRGVHCTAPPDSGIIPDVCERIDEREVCCP